MTVLEKSVGAFRGFEVVLRKECNFNLQENLNELEEIAEYFGDIVLRKIDKDCEEDFEDLLEYKSILRKIENIITDEFIRYNEKHNKVEEEE